MALVRGAEQYVSVSFVTGSANWPGTEVGHEFNNPTYPTEKLPAISATARNEVAYFPRPQEFGGVGGQLSAEKGMQIGRGEFTIIPNFYSKAMFKALASMCASCIRTANADLVGAAVPAGEIRATQAFMPQSFSHQYSGIVHTGMLRYFLSGETNLYTMIEYRGVLFTSITWSHVQGEMPRLTFRWIAEPGFRVEDPTTVVITPREDEDRFGVRYFKSFEVRAGGFMLPMNLTSFEITLASNLAFANTPLNDIDTRQKPGHENLWSVTGEVRHALEPATPESEDTLYHMLTMPASANAAYPRSLRFTYESDVIPVLSDEPYALDITIPKPIFHTVRAPVDSQRAVIATCQFDAVRDTFSAQLPMSWQAGGKNYKNIIAFQHYSSTALDGGQKWVKDVDGGYDPHTDLEV